MLNTKAEEQRYDTIVIGAGKSGLAAGYYLRRAGREFVILDGAERPGDAWRYRWDSLRLFSPAQWNSLPGMPFPAPDGTFATKDAMANYLDAYAQRFSLPIVQSALVTRVSRDGDQFVLESAEQTRYCSNLVVASGYGSSPLMPEFAAQLDPRIQQLHSSYYHRPADVVGAPVLVVGFGTSGADIAMELAASGRNVRIAGEPTMHIPPFVFNLPGNLWWRWLHHVLTIDTPIGRKLAPQMTARGAPLIRVGSNDVIAAGVRRVARVSGVAGGRPLLADGSVVDAAAVVWCTGFAPDYEFLDLRELRFNAKGWPIAPHGVVEQVPGLYFLGVPFQVGITSHFVGGADRDARLVVAHLEQRDAPPAHGPRTQPRLAQVPPPERNRVSPSARELT